MKYRIIHDAYRDRFKVEIKGRFWGWNYLSFCDKETSPQPTYGFYRLEDAKEFLDKARRYASKERFKKSPQRYTVVEEI